VIKCVVAVAPVSNDKY